MTGSTSTHTTRIINGLRVGPAKSSRDGSRRPGAKKRAKARAALRTLKHHGMKG